MHQGMPSGTPARAAQHLLLDAVDSDDPSRCLKFKLIPGIMTPTLFVVAQVVLKPGGTQETFISGAAEALSKLTA